MKKIFFMATAVTALFVAACNNSSEKNQHDGHDMKAHDNGHMAADEAGSAKTVQAYFTQVDANASKAISQMIDHYLHLKNELAGDNSTGAAKAGEALLASIGQLDKSLLSMEQKSLYNQHITGLKDAAQAITEQSGNISVQRQHFSHMSDAAYAMVKAFGAGRPIYHDHCPMYNDNKGGMWLSEMKEVKNPYFGAEMLTCGRVEEIIQ